MVIEKLSLATINATSPYLVKIADDGKALCFVTDYDAEMFITFEKDDLLHNGTVYQFGISNPKKVRSPRDPKVRIRKDNPQFRDLVTEFMNTVNLLNSKPEH